MPDSGVAEIPRFNRKIKENQNHLDESSSTKGAHENVSSNLKVLNKDAAHILPTRPRPSDSKELHNINHQLYSNVRAMSLEEVRKLLMYGANPNAKPPQGFSQSLYGSALGLACGSRTNIKLVELVSLLIAYGADVNAIWERKWFGSPLARASFQGHPDVVCVLLNSGAHVNAKLHDEYGSALAAAASSTSDIKAILQVIRLLIEHGAEVNAKLPGRYSCALVAAVASDRPQNSEQKIQVVRCLLQSSTSVQFSTRLHNDAINEAKVKGETTIEKILLESGNRMAAEEPEAWKDVGDAESDSEKNNPDSRELAFIDVGAMQKELPADLTWFSLTSPLMMTEDISGILGTSLADSQSSYSRSEAQTGTVSDTSRLIATENPVVEGSNAKTSWKKKSHSSLDHNGGSIDSGIGTDNAATATVNFSSTVNRRSRESSSEDGGNGSKRPSPKRIKSQPTEEEDHPGSVCIHWYLHRDRFNSIVDPRFLRCPRGPFDGFSKLIKHMATDAAHNEHKLYRTTQLITNFNPDDHLLNSPGIALCKHCWTTIRAGESLLFHLEEECEHNRKQEHEKWSLLLETFWTRGRFISNPWLPASVDDLENMHSSHARESSWAPEGSNPRSHHGISTSRPGELLSTYQRNEQTAQIWTSTSSNNESHIARVNQTELEFQELRTSGNRSFLPDAVADNEAANNYLLSSVNDLIKANKTLQDRVSRLEISLVEKDNQAKRTEEVVRRMESRIETLLQYFNSLRMPDASQRYTDPQPPPLQLEHNERQIQHLVDRFSGETFCGPTSDGCEEDMFKEYINMSPRPAQTVNSELQQPFSPPRIDKWAEESDIEHGFQLDQGTTSRSDVGLENFLRQHEADPGYGSQLTLVGDNGDDELYSIH